MAARVDLESGKLLTVGADKQGNTFTEHPMTRHAHRGLRPVPFWEEAKAMCLEAAQEGAADALCGLGCSHHPGRPRVYRGELLPQPRRAPVCGALPGRHRDSCGSSGSSSTSETPRCLKRRRACNSRRMRASPSGMPAFFFFYILSLSTSTGWLWMARLRNRSVCR